MLLARRAAARLALAAFASTATLLLGAPGASAASVGIHHVLPCATPHWSQEFNTGTGTHHDLAIKIAVTHTPGRFGLMTITDLETGKEIWSFRQSYAWVWGSYEMLSTRMPPASHDYRVDYWSDNLAQAPELCRAIVSLVRVGLDT